jgi:hypothetical protein
MSAETDKKRVSFISFNRADYDQAEAIDTALRNEASVLTRSAADARRFRRP